MRRAEWAVPALVLAGLVALPFYRADLLRERLIGEVAPHALSGLVLAASAVAVLSLLRRDFVRLHPALLTWPSGDSDAARRPAWPRIGAVLRPGRASRDRAAVASCGLRPGRASGDRAAVALGGLRRAWAVRFGVVGYLFVAGGAVLGWDDAAPLAAVVAAAGLFAYVAALRERTAWLEHLVVFGLAAAGAGFVGAAWLSGIAAGLLVATAIAWGPVVRPRRADLVAGHWAHVVRATSAAFGDVLAVLPRPRPTRMRLGGTLRVAVAGVVARRAMVAAALLLALVAPVLHAVFPAVAPVWWVGAGAYAATLPFAGGLADLTRVDGLRRWLPQTDTELWAAALIVLALVAGLWLAAAALAGLPVTPAAAPLAASAAVRTATRPHLDYTPTPALDLAGAYVPAGLLRQLVRGPLLLVVGLAALS